MKKVIIFLSILTILGCSDESPLTEIVETTFSSSVTLNENSTLVPNTRNIPVYSAVVMFSGPTVLNFYIPNNIPIDSKIKSIKINHISYTVDKYDCLSEELDGVINPSLPPGKNLGVGLITIKDNFSSSVELPSVTSLEEDLLSKGYALIYFHSTIPEENLTFDIRVSFDMDVSIEYIKD